MKVKPVVLLGACGILAAGLPGCHSREEAVKESLAEAGYEVTPEAYFRAAESDDLAALTRLLQGGIARETRNADGDTALHASAAAGTRQAAKFLLDRGIPVDTPGAGGRTPLMSAVLKGPPEMVRYLLKQGANPLAKDAEGLKPLMLAVREDRPAMIGELAAYDRDGLDNALLAAAILGHARVIDELTNFGASIYARTDDGRTALMLAAENGNEDAVHLLVDVGANRFAMDDQGRIAADLAREAGHTELARKLASEPGSREFGIEEPEHLGAEMEESVLAAVEAAEQSAEGDHSPQGTTGGRPAPRSGGTGGTGGAGHVKAASPALLEGAVLGAPPALASAEAGAGERAETPRTSAREYPPQARLIMRAYRGKELPLRIESVTGGSATIRIAGEKPRVVAQGAEIPGTPLTIVRLQRRLRGSKESEGVPTEVSVVEVQDRSTGRRRELISSVPSSAYDPLALVEDAATGRRYVARTGQRFRASDGTEFTVVDVRPNQMVVENPATHEVWTVPLRGPRG